MEIPASLFLQKLAQIDLDKLRQIKGLGPIMIENLQKYTQSESYQVLVKKFQNLESKNQGLKIKLSPDTKNLELGKVLDVVCITGTFELPRNQIAEKLEQKGYKVVNSLTKEVTILIAGDKAGSKLDKASQMGVRVVQSWHDLLQN